ncbi:PRA1 family protein [Entamoeba marina]
MKSKYHLPKDKSHAFKSLSSNLDKFSHIYLIVYGIILIGSSVIQPTLLISLGVGLLVYVTYSLCEDFKVDFITKQNILYVHGCFWIVCLITSILAGDILVLVTILFVTIIIIGVHGSICSTKPIKQSNGSNNVSTLKQHFEKDVDQTKEKND